MLIEDAANKVRAYSTVSNDIDELRKASILARRGPRKYELLLKDLGAYRELHRTRLPVRVPARPQDGLRERVAITLFAGDRIMGYVWLQETGAGFGTDVEYVLNGSAARASGELTRYRNQQSVHMREDHIARILSGPAESAASAHSGKIPAERPAALILIGISDAEAHVDDAALKHGELANLASMHAAAYQASAVMGQFKGDTAVIVPCLQSTAAEPGLRSLAEPSSGMPPSTWASAIRRRRAGSPGPAVHPLNHPHHRGPVELRPYVSGQGGRHRGRRPPPSATAAFRRCCSRTVNSRKPCTRTSTPHSTSPNAPAG